MELWFWYAILAALFVGFNNFISKIFADKNINSILIVLGQAMAYTLFWLLHGLYLWADFALWGSLPIFIATGCIMGVQFINTRLRVKILKYLSSSEYFVSFRLSNTVLLILLWTLFFHETIWFYQYIGLIFGSVGIALLFEEDKHFQHSRNWKYAIILLCISISCGASIQIIWKFLALNALSFPVLLFYQGIILFCLSIIFSWPDIQKTCANHIHEKKYWVLSMIGGVIYYIWSQCNLLAFEYGGNLSIVTKIIAYSLLVPILLSMIFYRERLTIKKGIALIFTIISIYYLN